MLLFQNVGKLLRKVQVGMEFDFPWVGVHDKLPHASDVIGKREFTPGK